MTHEEILALIRGAINQQGGRWADLGAGTGNFTRALGELLGADANLFAVDVDADALNLLRRSWREPAELRIEVADFTKPLKLTGLDGVLIANALHFVSDQAAALGVIAHSLKQGGKLVVVEYDVPTPWTPHPVPFARLGRLAAVAGLTAPIQIAERHSPRGSAGMYSAVMTRA
jgi:ubiquinone/menaquinone biosynthesis C-methylase UbiE